MNGVILPPDVYVADTGTSKGRGVFANRDFLKGEIVERAPVVILLRPFDQLPPRLQPLLFNWGSLTHAAPCSAIALGFGSIYNHDNPSNMQFAADVESSLLIYTTVRAIKKHEELTVNYNSGDGSNTSDGNRWFDQFGITPIVSES